MGWLTFFGIMLGMNMTIWGIEPFTEHWFLSFGGCVILLGSSALRYGYWIQKEG